MASSKNKLTEEQLRESIIANLLGRIFNKRTKRALDLLSKESPALSKANKRYEKALEYLIKSNEKEPNQADTLNYLGFALRKLGNFEEAEKYYLLGLNIITNRMNLAKERLEVLKNCNCEEYDELKELIEKN